MLARVRPRDTTATDVTRFAFSRNGPTSPAMSRISSVRGKIASALECTDCDERASKSRHRRPRRAHSLARNNPTGPAPTIKTSVSTPVWRIRKTSSPLFAKQGPSRPGRSGYQEGLNRIEVIGSSREMESYHLFHAARADLLRRMRRFDEEAR